MKIAVATPEEIRLADEHASGSWKPFPTDLLRPSEIRALIRDLIEEEDADDSGETEHLLVTMNRTVLDLVTHPESNCPGPMDYEDVFIWKDGKLSPLLDLYSEDWLSHFALGDVLDREL